MASTVLLAAFSGILRDQQMKPQPIFWIDSIEELSEWKDLRIQTNLITDFFHQVFNADHSNVKAVDMANNFLERMDLNTDDIMKIKNKQIKVKQLFDAQPILNGKVALVFSHYYIYFLKKFLFDSTIEEDIDFHVSREYEYQPLFTVINKITCNVSIAKVCDHV